MIKVLGDYHTHTIYSSGYKKVGTHAIGTIEDNAKVALNKGLKTLVISEHGPGHYLYGVKNNNVPIMKEEIKRLNEKYLPQGLEILLGVEANLIGLDGRIDIYDKHFKYIDILLMGYHYGAFPYSIKDGLGLYVYNPISKILKINEEKAIDMNTKAYIKAMGNYKIDIITHPGSKAKVNIIEVAKKASEVGTALEISSKHSELSVKSLNLLKDIDVYYYINSDAHRPEDVGNLENGIKKAQESKITMDKIKNIIVEGE